PLQLGLEGCHDPADDVVRGVHLPLLDLHDGRLADVRESRQGGLREPEGLPEPRDLFQIGHHLRRQWARGTYSYRNFKSDCILLAGEPAMESLAAVPARRDAATKAIYAPPHPRRTAVGGLPSRAISTSRHSSTRTSTSRERRHSSARASAHRTACPADRRTASAG